MGRDLRRLTLALIPGAALALCLFAVDLPLFVVAPGPARAVLPLIDVEGRRTYESRGRFLFTTVNVGRVNAYDALAGWWDPQVEVVPEREIIAPGQTELQYEQASLSEMDQSKIAGVSAALRLLTGYPAHHGPGAVIQDVVAGTPADGRLFPGDLVLEADGTLVRGVAELLGAIRDAGTERDLKLSVEPVEGGERRTVWIRPAIVEGEPRPVIGVAAIPNFPFPVRIRSGNIGGPSAGLMWALGVFDLLTPDDLTSGRTLAGTGDVDVRGVVQAIGGVQQKVLAAEEAGADVFLLPRANLRAARSVGADIDLVPVQGLNDAVRQLAA